METKTYPTATNPKYFKLQVYIPWELYEQLKIITDTGHGKQVYGSYSKIIILALRQYLNQIQQFRMEDFL